jgi:two-component system response regulator GlrR
MSVAHEGRPTPPHGATLNLIGQSPAFLEVLALITRIAARDVSVLLLGETGTGKEVAARAIHYLGARRERPFVPVNCGAIPETLVESELFGHCRGAFTDARDAHLGLVAQAEGGTLFLDEVDALTHKAQIALLRFLQDGTFRPLGARGITTSDVRIIAATNADLVALTAKGSFRADLLYRLMIMPIEMPPLRKRSGDAALLAEHFVRCLSQRYRTPPTCMHPPSLSLLEKYSWPGNVRELENMIHREFLLAEGEVLRLRAESLELSPNASGEWLAHEAKPGLWPASFSAAKAIAVTEFERAFLRRALAESGGNVSLAAQRAGKERRSFGKLLKKHGIDKRGYRAVSVEP